jgi:CubicO group peptidase (beta-lactamase class C family)
VQQLLNMDVANDYTRTTTIPSPAPPCRGGGRRLAAAERSRPRRHHARLRLPHHRQDTTNRTGKADYKSANTEVLGWIAERVSGRPLRHFLADIADAAGVEAACT